MLRFMQISKDMHWLFWDVEAEAVDIERDINYILGRVLERGRLQDVRWAIEVYGIERIHRFFRESGNLEISNRTLSFWKAFFRAEDEIWKTPPSWRNNNSAPWIS
jgi:hypothetical protein